VSRIVIRGAQRGDGAAIAQIHRENAEYYAELDPADFRAPDEEGLVEFSEPGPQANSATALALVAELRGEVAGDLEAEIQPPLDTAHWQSLPDRSRIRLYINYLGTARRHWRRGVATRLVEAGRGVGQATRRHRLGL
jgi:GNAT superfamily N-acetyltransferase